MFLYSRCYCSILSIVRGPIWKKAPKNSVRAPLGKQIFVTSKVQYSFRAAEKCRFGETGPVQTLSTTTRYVKAAGFPRLRSRLTKIGESPHSLTEHVSNSLETAKPIRRESNSWHVACCCPLGSGLWRQI